MILTLWTLPSKRTYLPLNLRYDAHQSMQRCLKLTLFYWVATFSNLRRYRLWPMPTPNGLGADGLPITTMIGSLRSFRYQAHVLPGQG